MIITEDFYINTNRDFYSTYVSNSAVTYTIVFENKADKKEITVSGTTTTLPNLTNRFVIVPLTVSLFEEGQYTYIIYLDNGTEDILYTNGLGTVEYSAPDVFEDEDGDDFTVYQDND